MSCVRTTLGLHRVTATCDPDNVGSWRVMENLGMRREGHERKVAWYKGRWHDTLRYAILEHAWQARQESVNAHPPREVNT